MPIHDFTNMEFISTAVLAITLVVLTIQTRTLHRSMQATTYNQIVDQNLRINEMLVSKAVVRENAVHREIIEFFAVR